MAKLFGKLFESVRLRYEQLKDRERKMVLALIALLAVGTVVLVAFWANATIGEKSRRIESLERQLEEIASLAPQYRKAKAKQESEER